MFWTYELLGGKGKCGVIINDWYFGGLMLTTDAFEIIMLGT